MKSNNVLEWSGCSLAAVLTAIQPEELFSIISLILTCIATSLTIAFTLYKWFKESKRDGKISKEEIEKGIDILKDGIEELSDKIDKGDKQ